MESIRGHTAMKLFVVCPCFNEEVVLATFAAHLIRVLNDLTSVPASAGSEPIDPTSCPSRARPTTYCK